MTPTLNERAKDDDLARKAIKAFTGLFTASYYDKRTFQSSQYSLLYLKPTKTIAAALSLDREVLLLVADYNDIQARTIDAATTIITELAIHVSTLDETLGAKDLRKYLARELFSADPFQVSGPVSSDVDFFGRRTEAQDIARQLRLGRIVSLFGLRKVGKTSFINRIKEATRKSNETAIALIDCSISSFYRLSPQEALSTVASCLSLAADKGYATLQDCENNIKPDFRGQFSTFLTSNHVRPITLIFDEVDSITPSNGDAVNWQEGFVEFWRELRSFYQESTRRDCKISLMVSGVSSKYFRMNYIGGKENSVLNFLPESYMRPFPRGAAEAMLKALGTRCGLSWRSDALNYMCEYSGDFPFWIRMAASYFHRQIEVDTRPIMLTLDQTKNMFSEFLKLEGAEIAKVGMGDLHLKFPELSLSSIVGGAPLDNNQVRILHSYGLLRTVDGGGGVKPGMVESGLSLLSQDTTAPLQQREEGSTGRGRRKSGDLSDSVQFSTMEWAEELAVISRRRNLIENDLRGAIRVALKMSAKGTDGWHGLVLDSIEASRRKTLGVLAGAALMESLYWLDLKNIILRHWNVFQSYFNDKKRFEEAMNRVNQRPDTHAKRIDAADVALLRQELDWLEKALR